MRYLYQILCGGFLCSGGDEQYKVETMLKIETGNKLKMASDTRHLEFRKSYNDSIYLHQILYGHFEFILFFGHNLGVNQNFCTKFGTVMNNRQPNATHSPEIRFSNIQDGRQPPS